VSEAAGFGEAVVFATAYDSTQEAIRSAGNLNGKIVFDCTNPLQPDLSGLTVGFHSSAAEQASGWAKGARVAKVFNTTGAKNMENSSYPGGAPWMFYCSDDAGAKAAAKQLATDLGFEAIDAGSLATARFLEPYAMLWIPLA
jgi:predicted dinucleotide-binding enzyme